MLDMFMLKLLQGFQKWDTDCAYKYCGDGEFIILIQLIQFKTPKNYVCIY